MEALRQINPEVFMRYYFEVFSAEVRGIYPTYLIVEVSKSIEIQGCICIKPSRTREKRFMGKE